MGIKHILCTGKNMWCYTAVTNSPRIFTISKVLFCHSNCSWTLQSSYHPLLLLWAGALSSHQQTFTRWGWDSSLFRTSPRALLPFKGVRTVVGWLLVTTTASTQTPWSKLDFSRQCWILPSSWAPGTCSQHECSTVGFCNRLQQDWAPSAGLSLGLSLRRT